MKEFNDLTRLGRIRRAKKIVLEGLVQYDLKVREMTFLTEDTNIFYKAIDEKGRSYAIKIYQEFSSNLDDSKVEMFFLDYVSKHTEVVVPRGVTNKSGHFVTVIDSKYDTVKKRMSVYEWMDGKDLDEREEVSYFEQIGSIMAELHNHAEHIELPCDIHAKRIDKVLYYAGDDYFYRMEKYQHKVTDDFVSFMDTIIPHLDKQLKDLYKKTPMLIHGDFNPFNIKVHKKEVRLLDFEDACMGLPLHDISTLFFYYRYDDNYSLYKDAFYKGYESKRPFNKDQEALMEMLMTARRVNFLNYVVELYDDPKSYIEKNLARVKAYFETYEPGYFVTLNC